MQKRQKSPTTNKFVYVVLEDDSSNKKKVHIVNDIDVFLKSCCQIFNNPNLQRILNDDGETVEDGSELIPENTYYATEISSDFVPIEQATTDLTANIEQKYELFKVPENDIKNKLKKDKVEAKEKKALIIKSKIQKIEAIKAKEKEKSSTVISSKFSVCSRASSKRNSKFSQFEPEEFNSMSESSVSEPVDDSLSMSVVSQRIRSRFGSDTGSVVRSRIDSQRRSVFGLSATGGASQFSLSKQDILNTCMPPDYGIEMAKVPDDLVNREVEQAILWQKNVSQMLFFNRKSESPFDPLNDGLAYDTLANHALLVGPSNLHHILKVNIVGPPNSGVPSLMRSFAKLYTAQLVAAETWKSHFLFGYDAKELVPLIREPAKLYKKMLDLVLNALSAQKPSISQYIPRIRKQMLSILDFEVPCKGLHPFHDIDIAARLFGETWRNDEALENWLTTVVSLPSIISSAVGFQNLTVFVDNLESADETVRDIPPFTESHNNSNFIEFIKYSLTRCNFVISCNKFNLLLPTDAYGIDITRGMETISTCQTPQDMLEGETQSIALLIANESKPIILDDNVHGGIPKFLDQWEKTQRALCKYERVKNMKKEVCYLEALEEAQKLADLVLCRTDGQKVSVQEIGRPYPPK